MSNKCGVERTHNSLVMGIGFTAGNRNNFYPPAVAILAMLAAAGVGLVMLPGAEVMLPLVADCRLDRAICSAPLPGGGRLEMQLEPRPVPSAGPMRVIATVAGARADRIEVSFTGVDMNMGAHHLPLAAAGGGRHIGETTLPVCVTGRMMWQATVTLEDGRRHLGVPFRFESGH